MSWSLIGSRCSSKNKNSPRPHSSSNNIRCRPRSQGLVVLVRGRVGEWLEVGAEVVRLVAVDTLRAEGFLAVDDAAGNLVGREVVFRSEGGGIAHGTLKFVSPEMDAVTRQVRVWAELDNRAGKLRSGQQGTLEIVR